MRRLQKSKSHINAAPILVTLLLQVVSVTGCASRTGVLELGPDTYTLSVGVAGTGSVSGNDTQAKREALAEANSHCTSKGKQILVQNLGTKSSYAGSTTEIIFRCFDANDPALRNAPIYRKDPDVIIENR